MRLTRCICLWTRQTFRSWLHWLVVDVPGGADPAKGRTLTQYKGPSPPKGVHRCVLRLRRMRWRYAAMLTFSLLPSALCDASSYVFLLFKQPAEFGPKHAQLAPPERNSFNVRARAVCRDTSSSFGPL